MVTAEQREHLTLKMTTRERSPVGGKAEMGIRGGDVYARSVRG
jgi:hypothetical protein